MLNFKRITLSDKALYEKYLKESAPRGCNFSFANVYLWGNQGIIELNGCLLTFSQFGKYYVYQYPLGSGDKKAAIEALILDANERGIPFRLSGLLDAECEELDSLFPDKFCFKPNRDASDYVYLAEDLAELKGKKYHGKRNHLNRFYAAHPDFTVEPLGDNNIEAVKQMTADWFNNREVPDGESFDLEKQALSLAFRDYKPLKLESLVLKSGGQVIAYTMASQMSDEIFDVHFEKARMDIEGAYTAINCEFAKHIRQKHPEIQYLNREEDMGIMGLRKSKLSYQPAALLEKTNIYVK